MITLQTYSYNCANGNVANQTSGVLNAAFADEKILILNYLSDVSLLNSEIRFNVALFASSFQQNNSNSAYYFLPFTASTVLATDINLAINNIPPSNNLVYAKINFVDNFTFSIKLRFFNTYDKENYITAINPNNRKQLLAGSVNATLLQDNLPSAYNTPKFIGLWIQQKTSLTSTTVAKYDYLAISPTFLNFGVMNTPIFSLLVNALNSNVVSIDTPTTIQFKVNYNQTIAKVRFWILDYTNASNNSISFINAYNAVWVDVSPTITQSPIGTFNANYVANNSLFTNGNTYYFIAVCYDSANNVVNSFVSQAFTAAGTQFCKPTVKAYFKDYINEALTSNIKTSPYDRLQSVVKYTSNCSNIVSITLNYDNNVITATKNGATYIISDSRLSISQSGNTTTILFDFRVESLWAATEVLFSWEVINDNEFRSVKFYQRVEVQQFQDVLPIKLIDTKLFDLANVEIEVEDLCNYPDNEFIIETTANDLTAYKQLAIFDNGGEISEEESFVGELPQLISLDLNLVDIDYIATKARFRADTFRTFGGILASIAKKKVDFYIQSIPVHVRGTSTSNNIGNFYPHITIPITDTFDDFDLVDGLGASVLVQYKFREGIAPSFDTLPLLDKAQLLTLFASRTGNCDIEIHPTLQSGLSEGTFRFEFIKFGIAPANSYSYNFGATTISLDTVILFLDRIQFTSIAGQSASSTFYNIRTSNLTIWTQPTAMNLATLNAAILLIPVNTPYEIQLINASQDNLTLTYTYL